MKHILHYLQPVDPLHICVSLIYIACNLYRVMHFQHLYLKTAKKNGKRTLLCSKTNTSVCVTTDVRDMNQFWVSFLLLRSWCHKQV
jgi:hypothetical protein